MLLSWKRSLPDSLDGSHCSKTPQCSESLCPNRQRGRMPVQSTPAQAGGIPTPPGAHRLEGWCPGRSFICVQPIVHFFAGGNVGAAALNGDTIPVGFPWRLFFAFRLKHFYFYAKTLFHQGFEGSPQFGSKFFCIDQ